MKIHQIVVQMQILGPEQESNPEKYCLNHNDPSLCRTIGDICDEGGFVRPEYPYCK